MTAQVTSRCRPSTVVGGDCDISGDQSVHGGPVFRRVLTESLLFLEPARHYALRGSGRGTRIKIPAIGQRIVQS